MNKRKIKENYYNVFNKIKKISLDFFKKYGYMISFLLILIVAIVTRFYKLADYPTRLHIDEVGMAYDALSLSKYGVDRYLNHLPVYLINFGGGQSALYAYLAALTIKVIGFTRFSIRFPAAILGIISIIACYFITKNEKGKKFALTFMVMVTIAPWHFMASRWGLDCNLMAPMSIIAICLLVNSRKKWHYAVSGFFIGLILYTYALSYLIIPVFLFFTVIYMLYTKKMKFLDMIVLGIPIFLLAIPLMLMLLVNNGYLKEIKGFVTIPKLLYYRGGELNFGEIKNNLVFLRTLFTNDQFTYNAYPEYGTIYHFAIFLGVLGFFIEVNNFVNNIIKRKFESGTILLFLFVTVIGTMLCIEGPNINKANAAFMPLLYFVTVSMKYMYKNFKYSFYIIVVIYIVSFCSFLNFYFEKANFVYPYELCTEKELIDVLEYAEKKYGNDDSRHFHICVGGEEAYIYTLFVNQMSPYEFNMDLHDGFKDRKSYGKYYFYNNSISARNIYIVDKNDLMVYDLKSSGFELEEFLNYYIAHN